MKLGLALSGGGFRATVYHLGVLARLAGEDRLEDVTYLSTVSGGSLCVGLVYALNGFRWPSSQAYLEAVVPQARQHLLHDDFTGGLLRRLLRRPWGILGSKAGDLSALLSQHWDVSLALRELPAHPRWMINATCYETGKNWRFERFRMGDYVFGYSHDTDVPLSDALAASAGFPGLIGPLVMDTTRHSWFRYRQPARGEPQAGADEPDAQGKTEPVTPAFERVHLWDGGVYDNHGLEGGARFREWLARGRGLPHRQRWLREANGREIPRAGRVSAHHHRRDDGPDSLAARACHHGAHQESRRSGRDPHHRQFVR